MGGRADSPHGPDGLSSIYKKSLREIADFKEPMRQPASPQIEKLLARAEKFSQWTFNELIWAPTFYKLI